MLLVSIADGEVEVVGDCDEEGGREELVPVNGFAEGRDFLLDTVLNDAVQCTEEIADDGIVGALLQGFVSQTLVDKIGDQEGVGSSGFFAPGDDFVIGFEQARHAGLAPVKIFYNYRL